MAKKSTRVLSFILSALLLVSMLPVVSMAEEVKYYTFDEAATTKNYYDKLDYSSLVGPANEEQTPNVFIIDRDWAFKAGEEPESVSFVFRGEKYTETYNKNRHMTHAYSVLRYITEKGMKNPIIIFTEGVYDDAITMSGGFTILGPKAGMNPNVPHGDPTKEWALSSNRKIPTAEDHFGEAVFRVENAGESAMRTFMDNSESSGVQTYLIDGVVFQGNGTGIQDQGQKGAGSRNWYVQNCIFDDCHSLGARGDGVGLGFDRKGRNQTYFKNLYVSNCYVINQNTTELYSGHAASVNFNGVSVQNSAYPLCGKINCQQWQGQTTTVTNCHFWNAKEATRENAIYFNLTWNQYCTSGLGNDEALFAATFRNNSFYHVNNSKYSLIFFGAAGNTKVAVEENMFVSEEGKDAKSPIDVKYITLNGKVTHVGIGTYVDEVPVSADHLTVGDYKLTNDRFLVRNNTFVGTEFQALPTIGNNLHKETKVELMGNLYLDAMDSTEGKVIDPYVEGADIYNKWVWLDAARTKASSDIAESDVTITSGGVPVTMNGYDIDLPAGPKEYTKQIEVSCNAENFVRVYESDASWTKGARIDGSGTYTLSSKERTSYYIVGIASMDQRTELNYKITINREANPDAKLNAVLPQCDIISSSNDGITHKYLVPYSVENFAFKLDVPAGAVAAVWNKEDLILSPDADGVYTTSEVKVGTEKSYEIWVYDVSNNRETFYLTVSRAENTETELIDVTAPEATGITAAGKTFTITVPANATALNLSFAVSEGATAELIDPVYQMPIAAKNGVVTISPVPGGKTTYPVIVYSQDGEHQQEWSVVVERNAKTDCELLGIAGTEKVGNTYIAYTANKVFLISATVSEGATYQIFTDAACTEKVYSPRVQLTDTTNTFWVKVFAEDTAYSSDAVKVLINTFADTTEPDNTPVKLPMKDDGILGVTGGEFSGNTVVIPLAPETEQYTFRVKGYDGYVARVYSDNSETPMRPANDTDITLDSGRTTLYVTATKGSGANKIVEEYTVYIISPRTYTYTDKQVAWAADYIARVGSNGWGLMKGYPDGSFGGDKLLTRYEMAAMMVRVAGANVQLYAAARNPFSDDIAEWALGYVKAASRMGMINGYEVKDEDENITFEFQGDKNSTRSEFFRVFTNAVLSVDVDKYYKANKEAIDAAVEALKLTDLDKIADWAKPAVYTAIYMELVQGDHNKKVNPESNVTRNEVAVVLGRYYDILEGTPIWA